MSGLMLALQLKREGSNVTVLEQDSSTVRSSHNAGITFGPCTKELLEKCDDTGRQAAYPINKARLAFRRMANVYSMPFPRHNTSWGLMYRILRANFDGLATPAVSNPPPPRAGDGLAKYLPGQRVLSLDIPESGPVTVHCLDTESGKESSITADLLIGADGRHSKIRQLVGAPKANEYSGYVCWRGTVPEKELTPETREYFQGSFIAQLTGSGYLILSVLIRISTQNPRGPLSAVKH
jgi:2-polyprenyl-6-methoxyphenol hydroxylase-like FAD-dependent oxidoreductase